MPLRGESIELPAQQLFVLFPRAVILDQQTRKAAGFPEGGGRFFPLPVVAAGFASEKQSIPFFPIFLQMHEFIPAQTFHIRQNQDGALKILQGAGCHHLEFQVRLQEEIHEAAEGLQKNVRKIIPGGG